MPGILPSATMMAIAKLSADAPAYPTMEEAVQAALRQSITLPQSSKYEYGGMVVKGDDGFRYTQPVNSRDPFNIAYKFTAPAGQVAAAMYHTHPLDKESHLFSKADLDMANKMKIPSFIHALGTDDIQRLSYEDGAKTPVAGTLMPNLSMKIPAQTQVAALSENLTSKP